MKSHMANQPAPQWRRFGSWYSFVLTTYEVGMTLNDYVVDADTLRIIRMEDERLSVIFRGSKLLKGTERAERGEGDKPEQNEPVTVD